LLLGLAIHLSVAAGTLQAQSAMVLVEAVSDWSWYHNMGWRAFKSGDYETAAYRFGKAIETIKPHREAKPRLLVQSYYGMSRALYAQKRYAAAEPLARWVVDVQKASPAARTSLQFDCLYTLALIQRELHKDAQAESLFHEALRIEEKAVGPNDFSLAATLYDLASVEFKQEKYDRAELHLRRALAIYKQYNQTRTSGYVAALERYAKVLDQLDRGDDARAAEEAVEQLRAGLGMPKDQPAGPELGPSLAGEPGEVRPATP
jgi:tetratricopeptide (TPR) repeat protein